MIPEPFELFRLYDTGTKKRFGQHFLTDARLLDRVVRVADVQPGDRVLEVGPGCGTLTSRLLAAGASVTAVELDRDAAAFVRDAFAEENFRLVEADAVALDYRELLGDGPWKVVANLPYNVGTQITFALLESGIRFEKLALMFQLEVAERMTAEPRTKAYGAMTLQLQELADISLAFRVKPGSFSPPPKVDSAVVRISPHDEPVCPEHLSATFRSAVTAGFATRRKTLRNGLKARYGAELAGEALAAADISPKARAEELSFDDFVRLAAAIHEQQAKGE